MKTHWILALLASTLFLGCKSGASENEFVTMNGVGPVELEKEKTALPESVENLYDRFEVVSVESYYDDFEDEMIPGYDYLSFLCNDEEIMRANLNNGKITSITVISPSLTYGGIGPGMSISQALEKGAKCYVAGNYESCIFGAELRYQEVVYGFDFFNGQGFSDTGVQKLYEGIDGMMEQWVEAPFTQEDFLPNAVITAIYIRR